MSIWIEIHCDAPITERKNFLSDRGSFPSAMSENDEQAVSATVRSISGRAKKGGWVMKADGWLCPVCAKAGRTPA